MYLHFNKYSYYARKTLYNKEKWNLQASMKLANELQSFMIFGDQIVLLVVNSLFLLNCSLTKPSLRGKTINICFRPPKNWGKNYLVYLKILDKMSKIESP